MAQRRSPSIPAAQYVRASSGLQACSIAQQTSAIAAYAAMRGFEIVETYSDNAISGLTLKARPALQRLIAASLAPQRLFDAILVFDVSRWGRFQDIDHGAHLEFICRRAGVAVHYCAEPFDNDGSPEADLIKQIKRAIAAEFSRATSKRIALAKQHTNARGLHASGSAPFGMLREIIDPRGRPVALLAPGQVKVASNHRVRLTPGPLVATATVKQIFRLFVVCGLKLGAIAELLNEGSAPSPSGLGWNEQRLRRVLRDEVYIGIHVYGRTRHELGVCVDRPARPEWRRVANAWPATVPRWLFDKAQQVLAETRRWSDERMLDDLRELLASRGRLDTGLIDNTPGVRNACTYIKRFGSLAAAYERIGYSRGRRQ